MVTRGLAYDNGKIFLNTLDDYSVAIDANTGKELWHTKLGDINQGETVTMAPIVVKGKVLIGNSGGEMGVRGWLTAVDENTGKIAWRAYWTGPDFDVLIGDDFNPHYNWLKGKDLGVKSWPPDKWQIGGAGVWGWISYDPDLNLIYYGTANPGAWNHEVRPGDNLWSSSLFARDPDTGNAKWADSIGPHDLWDYDEINENILIDLPIDNQVRKVLVHPGRNGFMYVVDRTTGEVLVGRSFRSVNTIKSIDLKTGRPVLNDETHAQARQDSKRCVSGLAWSEGLAARGLVAAHQTPLRSASAPLHELPDQRGRLYRGYALCRRDRRHVCGPWWTPWRVHGVGSSRAQENLVHHREVPGLDRRIGDRGRHRLLWHHGSLVQSGRRQDRAGAVAVPRAFRFIGQPTTFVGNDGVQYVAIISGVGGWPGVVANAEIDPRVRNGALGFTGAMQDLPAQTVGGNSLLVFALPKTQSASTQPNQANPGAPNQGNAPTGQSNHAQ